MQSPEPEGHDKVLDNNSDRIWKCWVLRRREHRSTLEDGDIKATLNFAADVWNALDITLKARLNGFNIQFKMRSKLC